MKGVDARHVPVDNYTENIMAIIEVRAWDTTLAERSTGIKRVVIANQLNIPP